MPSKWAKILRVLTDKQFKVGDNKIIELNVE